jgi:hypothetical protein
VTATWQLNVAPPYHDPRGRSNSAWSKFRDFIPCRLVSNPECIKALESWLTPTLEAQTTHSKFAQICFRKLLPLTPNALHVMAPNHSKLLDTSRVNRDLVLRVRVAEAYNTGSSTVTGIAASHGVSVALCASGGSG